MSLKLNIGSLSQETMARALISCVQEQLISFLQENEDVDSFLVQKAKQGLGLIVGGLEEKVQKLINNFEDIQAVLEDAERKQVKEASVRRWLKKLKDVDHDVEDLLEEWNTAKLRSKLEREERNAENEPLLKKVRYSISSYYAQLIKHLGIAQKINDFNERLDVIALEKDRYMFQVDEKGVEVEDQLDRQRTVSFVNEKKVYGRDEAKRSVLRMVLSENTTLEEESSLPVISIVGMGEIGKTTLAQLVFNAPEIKSHFDERFWVCVSKPFDNIRIAKAILEIIRNEAPNLVELETLLKNVRECVSGRKILLVLDDVWTHNPRIWEQLKDSLESCSPGSKILITTRNKEVAINVGTLPANIFAIEGNLLSQWDQIIRFPGLPASMSMSDQLNHIGNCISEQMTSSGEDLQGRDLLEEITQYLLSDSQHTSASDEQSLMSRVNSLCCLLQKDPAGAPTFNIKEDDVDLMISSY